MASTTPAGRASVPARGRITGRASVPASPAAPPPPPTRPHRPALAGGRRRRWRKVLLAIALTLVVLVGAGAIGGWLYLRSLDDNMGRIEVFSQISGERPTGTPGALNVLVLGSDSRDPGATDVSAEAETPSEPTGDPYRADTIMLMHIPSSKDRAYLISIPRDLWVYIPPNADGTDGDYNAKINAATALGGVPLAVQTVETYTGVRIDHVMLIDFAGFVEVTDALGGVDMNIPETIQSIHGDRRTFEQGNQHLNGEEALDYIRQRYQFADGDFQRMRNQQAFLKALMDKAASSGTLTNPGKLNAFLQTATSTLTVDENFSLLDVGWSFRRLRSDNLTFMTSPHLGTGNIEGQSVVLSDDETAAALYAAVHDDRMAQWVADHPDQAGED